MNKQQLVLFLKRLACYTDHFIPIIESTPKSSTKSKSESRSILYGLLFFGFSLNTYQLSASENSKPIEPTINSSNDLLPQLINYSPMPCVTAGSSFSIRGTNFKQLDSAIGNFSLAIERKGKHESIEYQRKSDSLLLAVMPLRMENTASVHISLLDDTNWGQNSIEVKLCSANDTKQTTPPSRQATDSLDKNPSKENETRSAADTSETTNQRNAQTGPDPDKSDTDASVNDNDLKRRIANRQTEGSLLGSGLPRLPQELRLKQTKNASTYVTNELIAVSADIDQAKQLAKIMSGYQARAIRRKTMSSLGMVLTTFRLAPGYTVGEILEQIKNGNQEIWIDANHFYYTSAKTNTKNKAMKKTNKKSHRRTDLFTSIGLINNHQCNTKTKIGILDGPVDQKVDSLTNQSIIQKQMFSRGKKSASSSHGTAIASLLVGSSMYPELAGVINHAELAVAVVMQEKPDNNKKIFSTTESLILGLNWLVEQKVNVINLSLGGPRNALLEIALSKVLALDIGVVAAGGNGGSNAGKSYPAAQSGVIAVSALDSESKLAEDATQGDYIELSAPGVDLWVASNQSNAHYQSGSSLAAPLVAAALAQLGGSPKHAPLLFKASKDLGEPGKDSKFGWGLLQFPPCNN